MYNFGEYRKNSVFGIICLKLARYKYQERILIKKCFEPLCDCVCFPQHFNSEILTAPRYLFFFHFCEKTVSLPRLTMDGGRDHVMAGEGCFQPTMLSFSSSLRHFLNKWIQTCSDTGGHLLCNPIFVLNPTLCALQTADATSTMICKD